MEDKHIKKVVREFDITCQKFCYWAYLTNSHQLLYSRVSNTHYQIDDITYEDASFMSLNLLMPVLQESWRISIARLDDPSYFINQKTGEKKINVSVRFILKDDKDLQTEWENGIPRKFFSSIRTLRNGRDVHNTEQEIEIIKSGVKEFFKTTKETLEKYILQHNVRGIEIVDISYKERMQFHFVKKTFNVPDLKFENFLT